MLIEFSRQDWDTVPWNLTKFLLKQDLSNDNKSQHANIDMKILEVLH